VLDAYLLRAMGVAGWAPALRECAVCGTPGRTGLLRTGRRRVSARLPPARRAEPAPATSS
jgi:DNA repair protein RecO (recombination protein O)